MTSSQPPAPSKKRLRKRALALRNQIPPEVRAEKSQKIVTALKKELSKAESPLVVTSFVAMGSECDLSSLNQWLLQEHTLLLPTTSSPGLQAGEMEFVRITNSTTYLRSSFGVSEPLAPPTSPLPLVHITLLPGLAFDPAGGRLGYGGGYYDRFLSKLQKSDTQHNRVRIIGVGFSEQIIEKIPMEPHDHFLQEWVTDQTWHTVVRA